MNIQEIKKMICRICLDDGVVLDWSAPVYGYCDITYKDCFYKYTQLNCPASETFSSMLCQICLNGLYNVHTFILKALESHSFFEGRSGEIVATVNFKDIKHTAPKFESVLVEKLEVEPTFHNNLFYDSSGDEVANNSPESNRIDNAEPTKEAKQRKLKFDYERRNEIQTKRNKSSANVDHNKRYSSKKSFKVTRRKLRPNPTENNSIKKETKRKLEDETEGNIIEAGEQVEPKVRKKYKEIKKPRMCSICSKILHNKYAVELHEKTHMDNRERNETCKICGLKFYDKRNLYSHKRIHKENREKIHKCEFCNKTFYNKGGLNIHRRIHLGQMIPCTLCPKEFYRQIDLDRHMSSHSATTINSDTKKRSRYFVRCKHCGKSILSTSFKSHTAAHLNEPLMKCSICSKEFFRRASCVLHIKKIHQKTNEEYNNFITLYTKNRISHLFLEQKAEIQSIAE